MLKAEHVTVRYGEKTAAEDLSLEIREGEWWTVVGPNGAGKSTLAGAIGKAVPYEGRITLDGKEIREIPEKTYARRVGMLSQNHGAVFGFTVEEVVSLGRYARKGGFLRGGDEEGPEKTTEALEAAGLAGMRKRNMLTLSGGEAQRVGPPDPRRAGEPPGPALPEGAVHAGRELAEEARAGGADGDARPVPGEEIRNARAADERGKMRRPGKNRGRADPGKPARRVRDGYLRLDDGNAQAVGIRRRVPPVRSSAFSFLSYTGPYGRSGSTAHGRRRRRS